MPEEIRFRYFNCVNGSNGVTVYPMLKNSDGGMAWDGRDNNNLYWQLMQGQSKIIDLNKDLNADGGTIGGSGNGHSISSGSRVLPGVDVVAGNDDWISQGNNHHFIYDADSNVQISIRKYGGARDGDVAYDGCSVHT